LHELHTALHHASGEEAGARERSGSPGLRAIHFANGFTLRRKIAELGNGSLHAEGHFILLHAGLNFSVADGLVALLVKGIEAIEHASSQIAVDPRGVTEVKDGIAFRAQRNAGVFSGKEARAPET